MKLRLEVIRTKCANKMVDFIWNSRSMVAAAKYAVGLNKEISDCGNSLTKTPYAMTSYVNDDS